MDPDRLYCITDMSDPPSSLSFTTCPARIVSPPVQKHRFLLCFAGSPHGSYHNITLKTTMPSLQMIVAISNNKEDEDGDLNGPEDGLSDLQSWDRYVDC